MGSHVVNWSTFDGGFDIDDPTNTFTVSELIEGTGSLTKHGAGTLVSSAANTYSGGTTIEQGTLRTTADNVIPAGQFFLRDGTLDLSDHFERVGPGAVNQTGLILGGVAGATPEILLGDGGDFSVSTLGTFIQYDATSNPGTATITGGGSSVLSLATSSISRDFDIGDSTATDEELIVDEIGRAHV